MKIAFHWIVTGAILLLCAPYAVSAVNTPAPTGMMIDLMSDPSHTPVIHPAPKFTWIVNSTTNNAIESAYEIRVATTVASLDDESACTWSSGKVTSSKSTAVGYVGAQLKPMTVYEWKVRVWIGDVVSDWSRTQEFTTSDFATLVNNVDRFSENRYPLVQTAVAPREIVEIEKGHFFVDFGRDAFAGLQLKPGFLVKGEQKIIVHLGEALEKVHQINRKPGGSIRYRRAEMILGASPDNTYRVPLDKKDARRMPAGIGPVMPFRYVEIENIPSLDAQSIRQIAVHYPFDDTAARFESSDKTLNDVWEVCKYTMKATSFCGVYIDGDRERTPYEADAYLNQLGQYASDREFTLARYSHEYLIQHATWPTEWPMHSVFIAWADYLYTGDDSSLSLFYNDLKAKTLYRLAGPDLLISTAKSRVTREILQELHESRLADIVDWPVAERDAYDMKPVNTVVNAFHYRAMVLMAQIAAALNHPEDEVFFKNTAAKIAVVFNQKFWDPQTGLYIDGEGSSHSSLHANMCALAFDLVPLNRLGKVAAFVESKGMACSVYGAQYLMEALYRCDGGESALQLLTSHSDRSWAHMIDEVGSTITLEAWDNRFKPNQDWNHAWGAAPANVIPRLLMGIEPIEPGGGMLRIHPQPGHLNWAKMDLPTVRGAVHVEFKSSKRQFDLSVHLPANTVAEVWLPSLTDEDDWLTVDHVKVRGRREGRWLVLSKLGSGDHQIVRVQN